MAGSHVDEALLFIVVLSAAVALFLFLGAMTLVHGWRLGRVGLRVHVAGTRGKTRVVRLIAAGLRAGGMRVVAKTTGTEPRLSLPDATEHRVRRFGAASIVEERRAIARAAAEGADAAVIECMAIRPELVRAAERYLVRSHIAVLTNARPDHLEDLGPDPTAAFAEIVPRNGRLVVAEEALTPALSALARERGCVVTGVATTGLAPEAANRALALAACVAAATAEETARAGFAAALADPGGFAIVAIDVAGKRLRFANAFACNDTVSLATLWRSFADVSGAPPVVLLNTRADRPLRTRAFLEFLAALSPAPIVFVAGAHSGLHGMARKAGLGPGRVRRIGTDDPAQALARLAAAAAGSLIWGIGNYHSFGERLTAHLAAHGEIERARC